MLQVQTDQDATAQQGARSQDVVTVRWQPDVRTTRVAAGLGDTGDFIATNQLGVQDSAQEYQMAAAMLELKMLVH